jgi:hypothetical protein
LDSSTKILYKLVSASIVDTGWSNYNRVLGHGASPGEAYIPWHVTPHLVNGGNVCANILALATGPLGEFISPRFVKLGSKPIGDNFIPVSFVRVKHIIMQRCLVNLS